MKQGRWLSSLLTIAMASAFMTVDANALPRTQSELRAVFDGLTKTSTKYGDIPALFTPETITVNEAANSYDADEQMLLVAYPDHVRAYPQSIMVWHEVVNEYMGGEAYCVTYSPITGSFAAYHSNAEGINLTMDSEGRLYNNNSVLIDRNTGSLWMQLPGIAFDGPFAGKGLKMLPVLWTDWAHVRKAFPEAKIMARPRGTGRNYGKDPYGSYRDKNSYYQNEVIFYPLTQPLDRRMPPKRRVLGIEKLTASFAVDIEHVKEVGFVNFFLGPYPLLAVYDETIGSVRVFDRTVWGKNALFRLDNGQLVDVDTESRWNLDGYAVEGNLKGATLEQLNGIYSFWFAWAQFYPDTVTVPGPTVVPESALVKGSMQ